MNQIDKQVFFHDYNRSLHILGKIMLAISFIAMIGFSFFAGIIYNSNPDLGGFLAGFLSVGVIYYPVAIVEFLVYAPMLGVGGSYLAFLTGNLTNLKIPCAMNARELSGVKPGTAENEIISTISVATSAIVTTVILAAGVLLMTPLQPVLNSAALQPAFNNVVPALFGAFGLKYYLKSPKIAVVPFIIMTLLCIFVPAVQSNTSIAIIPAGLMCIGIGAWLDKKGKLGDM
jgi:hypothetical protein